MVLFFLPHAGGSAKSYSSFKRFLPKELKVIPMELSGQFTRSGEPLYTDAESCVADLVEKHIEILTNEEYAVFGHSMGTVLACELVRQVRERGLKMPVHIFLSGKNPPDEGTHCFKDVETASDEEIVSFFAANSMSGAAPVPDEELMKILNRILCVDVRMAERYSITPEQLQFDCDITVFYGSDDILMQGADMNSWSRFTKGNCQVICYSGGHFYYTDHKEEVCKVIAERIC